MTRAWPLTRVRSVDQLFDALRDLQGGRWAFRGQPKCYPTLSPSIERDGRNALSRLEKLHLERRSIDTFRYSAKFFSHHGEEMAMKDDIIALKVLQHYGAPTRLLDWTTSPDVAVFFAAESHPGDHAEIWAFDEPQYEIEGLQQWKRWPETTRRGAGGKREFDPHLTAFRGDAPPDWFICVFYLEPGFPRQLAQHALSTMTARFSLDHADYITRLLPKRRQRHRFEIPNKLKPELLGLLRSNGVWRGSLFSDSAGAAETAARCFPRLTGRP